MSTFHYLVVGVYMPKMVATVSQTYDGKSVSKDSIFDVKNKDVRLLRALGRVTDLVVDVKKVEKNEEPIFDPMKFVETFSDKAEDNVITADNTIGAGTTTDPNWGGNLVVPPKRLSESVPDMSIETELVHNTDEYSRMLRERAISLGIRLDGRWSDARVQREIDEYNKTKYQRMDMRATEE